MRKQREIKPIMNCLSEMTKLDNLEKIRKAKGYSRRELADISKVNQTTIQYLEEGRYNINAIKLSTLIALAQALKVKARKLLPSDLQKLV